MRRGRLVRLARRLGLDRNPLRRRTDRIEALIMAGLVVLFLAGAPLFWSAAGRWEQQGGAAEQRAQQSWQAVPAVVIKGQREWPLSLFRLPVNTTVPVLARWRAPDGVAQAAKLAVPAGDARAGSRVRVWVNPAGQPTGPPLADSQLAKRVIGAELLALVTLTALLLGLARLVHWQLNRRRLAGWEAEWATIGPGWTRHR